MAGSRGALQWRQFTAGHPRNLASASGGPDRGRNAPVTGSGQAIARRGSRAFSAALGHWRVRGGVEVQQLAIVGQGLKAVGEALGNDQRPVRCRRLSSSACQCRNVGEPRRRSTATSNTWPLIQLTSFASACGGMLKMHPSDDPGACAVMVRLIWTMMRPGSRSESSRGAAQALEPAARIGDGQTLEDFHAGQRRSADGKASAHCAVAASYAADLSDARRSSHVARLAATRGASQRSCATRSPASSGVASRSRRLGLCAVKFQRVGFVRLGRLLVAPCGAGHLTQSRSTIHWTERASSLAGPKFHASAKRLATRMQRFREGQVPRNRFQHVLPWPYRAGRADGQRRSPASDARRKSGTSRSAAQSPPPITLPARALAKWIPAGGEK